MNGFNNNTSTYAESNLFGIKKYIFLIPSEVKKKLPKIRWKLCFSCWNKGTKNAFLPKNFGKISKDITIFTFIPFFLILL